MSRTWKDWKEALITFIIRASGYSAILFVAIIFIFLLTEGLPALGEVPLGTLLSTRWYPIEAYFGLLPLIGGSLIVGPLGEVLAGPLYGQEGLVSAIIDTDSLVGARYDLDVAGHYARPDVFRLEVDERPRPPVAFRD